ncbi:hypothetical protein CRG98_020746 [Punica granatum]|uniref:Uncharacterized protein n=1 Tax=Punica granatum TaxID=22663 RepID=A0A2I0JRA7_PUNGR|nr:hypothetical protein CRG98_020746 [Punica granatum]
MEKSCKISRLKDRGGILLLMLIFVMARLALLRLRDRIESDLFGALRGWHYYDGEMIHARGSGSSALTESNLKDLCLGGTLALEIENLAHIKSIILRNNTFSGFIPEEIRELKELEVLE